MRAGWALAALLSVACTPGPPRVGLEPPALANTDQEQAYRAVLRSVTSRSELYDAFDTNAFVAATLQTPEFRAARARREAAFREETAAELEGRLLRERTEAAAAHEWIVGLNVSDPAHQDLDRKGSTWRLAMITPSGTVLPTRIERVGRASLPLRAIYPYLDNFWVAYRVWFPREIDGRQVIPPGSAQVTLQLAGVLGNAELVVQAP